MNGPARCAAAQAGAGAGGRAAGGRAAGGRAADGRAADGRAADGRAANGRTALDRPTPDLRLAPAALAAWLLSWWGTAERARPVLLAAVAATVLLTLVLLGLGARRLERSRLGALAAGVGLVVAAGASALAATGVRLQERERDPLTAAATAHAFVRFAGTVRADPKRLESPFASGGDRFAVRVAVGRLTVRGRSWPSRATVVVMAGESWAGLVAGSHVTGGGRLAATDPGDSAVALAFARGSPTVIDRGGWVWQVAERLRVGLRAACRALPTDARGLLPALVVGDTSRLDPGLKADLRAAGLSHLTAVSGANVGIFAAAVIGVITLLGGGRRLRVTGTAVAMAGFVVLARPEPSVLRASVMGGLMLLGLLWARGGAGIPVLAATSLILLVADPWLARSYGFVLSVLATAGLLLIVPAWLARPHRVPRWAVLALAVPLAAQLATAPVTVLLDPAVSLVAVPANVLAEVAVAPATIAGVLAAGLSPFWPGGARLVAWPGGLATEWIAAVAHRAAAVPGGSLPWPQGPGGAALLALLCALAVVLARRRHRWALGLCLVVAAGTLSAPRWVWLLPSGRGWPPPDWTVIQCDVGQGSATLIRSGDRRAVMVDTGPDPGLANACLRRARVRALDLVVITHFHADHAGGLAGALGGRGSPPIVVSPLAEPRRQAGNVEAAARSVGRRPVIAAAPLLGRSGQAPWVVSWRIVPPTIAGAQAPTVPSAGEESDGPRIHKASLVVAAQVRGVRVTALGDVEPEVQRPLVPTLRTLAARDPGIVPVDVVVVAHHGSARQEPSLYRLLRPRVALIGVGAGNDYGHPAPSALAMLRQIGALTLRTDRQGQLAVAGSGTRLRTATTK